MKVEFLFIFIIMIKFNLPIFIINNISIYKIQYLNFTHNSTIYLIKMLCLQFFYIKK